MGILTCFIGNAGGAKAPSRLSRMRKSSVMPGCLCNKLMLIYWRNSKQKPVELPSHGLPALDADDSGLGL